MTKNDAEGLGFPDSARVFPPVYFLACSVLVAYDVSRGRWYPVVPVMKSRETGMNDARIIWVNFSGGWTGRSPF